MLVEVGSSYELFEAISLDLNTHTLTFVPHSQLLASCLELI